MAHLKGLEVAILVEEAVVDDNLVSSRTPDDIPAFSAAMIELFSRARQESGRVA